MTWPALKSTFLQPDAALTHGKISWTFCVWTLPVTLHKRGGKNACLTFVKAAVHHVQFVFICCQISLSRNKSEGGGGEGHFWGLVSYLQKTGTRNGLFPQLSRGLAQDHTTWYTEVLPLPLSNYFSYFYGTYFDSRCWEILKPWHMEYVAILET